MNDLRSLALSIAASMTLFGTGCEGVFYTTTTTGFPTNTGTVTFSNAFPTALEDVFATCHEPLTFTPDTTALDLGGTCTATGDLPTSESQLLWIFLNAEPAVNVTGVIPADVVFAMTDIYHIDNVFPWPVQNCEVYIDLGGMNVNGVQLGDLQASWATHSSGSPALHVDFDGVTGTSFASGIIDGDVDCPNPINEPFLQPMVPDGFHRVLLNNLDLDVWLKFSWTRTTVTATPQVDFNIGSITIDPPLSEEVTNRVGSFEQMIEDFGGISKAQMETNVETALAPMLNDIAANAAAMIQDAVPENHQICNISVSGGQLIMRTARLCPLPLPM